VLTPERLLVAGGASLIESAERHGQGYFWIASRKDGAKQAEAELPAPPVLDGMVFTNTGIFVAAVDGTVICLRKAE
jgi:hypothetical protein